MDHWSTVVSIMVGFKTLSLGGVIVSTLVGFSYGGIWIVHMKVDLVHVNFNGSWWEANKCDEEQAQG